MLVYPFHLLGSYYVRARTPIGRRPSWIISLFTAQVPHDKATCLLDY